MFYRQRYKETHVENENFMTRVWDEIEATAKSTTGVRDGFARIIDLCAASQPRGDWDRFPELDIEACGICRAGCETR